MDPVLAQAGSGSSGFGGGGGGGGSGGYGGGYTGGGGGEPAGAGAGRLGDVLPWLLVAIAVLAVAIFVYRWTADIRYQRRLRRRVRHAHSAAAEAEPHFAPDVVQEAGRRLFLDAQAAWNAGDRKRLANTVAPELMREWARRLDDFASKGWRQRVMVLESAPLLVHYVGLHAGQQSVVVRIRAEIASYVVDARGQRLRKLGDGDGWMTLREYWTLTQRDGRWIVASVEQRAEGDHHLRAPIVAAPWADETRLRDEAMTELAGELPSGYVPADLDPVHFEGDARAAALDMALADPRFSPEVIEAAARRAVEAWAAAVDGDREPLEALASPEAVAELLYGGDGATRLVVRGPRVERIEIAAVRPHDDPPTITIDVELDGRRYVEDRDTGEVRQGSKRVATTFDQRWTLALDARWRIVGVAQSPV